MKKYLKWFFLLFASATIAVSCNSDEGSTTTDNDDPGNADSVGAGQTNNNNVDNADAEFLADAYYSGLKEIEASKAAQSKGQAKEVTDLANMMVTDHTAMGAQVKGLAAKKNISLKESLTPEDLNAVSNKDKTGKEFDRGYTTMMVDDHEAAVRKFENAANNARDPEIKALANEALPKLRHHLEQSKAARDKVKG